MNYVDHDHKHTVKRGGSIMSGSSNYDDSVVINTPEYNKFDLSHSFRSTGKIGIINPCLNLSVIAGDSVKITPSLFQRFRPLVSPVVTPIESSLHLFYVPARNLDYSFDQFLTGGVDGTFADPLLTINTTQMPMLWEGHGEYLNNYIQKKSWVVNGRKLFGVGSLLDEFNYGSVMSDEDVVTHMYKVSAASTGKFNLFPLIAYHKVYNDYYRAEEIETDLFMPKVRTTYRMYAKAFESAFGAQTLTTPQEIVDFLHNSPAMQGFAEYMLRNLSDPLLADSDIRVMGVGDDKELNFYTLLATGFHFNGSATPSIDDEVTYDHDLKENGQYSDSKMVTVCLRNFLIYLLSADCMPWERDRYTTALPYLQRGISEYIHVGVSSEKMFVAADSVSGAVQYLRPDGQAGTFKLVDTTTNRINFGPIGGAEPSVGNLYVQPSSSGGSNITMDDIRRLNAVTRFLEKSARVGYRFTEYLQGMFGVDVKAPSHLEKPVYIGGLKGNADINTIYNSADVAGSTLGDYAGAATSFNSNSIDAFSVPEHGVIIGVYGTKPRSSYINSVDRNNMKYADRTVFFTPDFAHLQEQPILRGDVDASALEVGDTDYLNGKAETSENFFGYEPRYNEYRFMNSTTHGEFVTDQRSFTTSRKGIDQNYQPAQDLVNDYAFQHVSPYDDCVNRIFNVDASLNADHFISEVSFMISKLSLMPSQATPSL